MVHNVSTYKNLEGDEGQERVCGPCPESGPWSGRGVGRSCLRLFGGGLRREVSAEAGAALEGGLAEDQPRLMCVCVGG